jgi:hypothetical protein
MQQVLTENNLGIGLLERHINEIVVESPEIGDFREGIQAYCEGKY